MEALVKSDVFDLGDSTYLIDVVRNESGEDLIRLKRTVHRGPKTGSRSIEFNEYVLNRIMALWVAKPESRTWSTTSPSRTNPRLRRVSEEDRAMIVKVYLKNVSPSDIAVRYGCKAEDIEQVLREAGLPIEPTTPPKRRYWRKRY